MGILCQEAAWHMSGWEAVRIEEFLPNLPSSSLADTRQGGQVPWGWQRMGKVIRCGGQDLRSMDLTGFRPKPGS